MLDDWQTQVVRQFSKQVRFIRSVGQQIFGKFVRKQIFRRRFIPQFGRRFIPQFGWRKIFGP